MAFFFSLRFIVPTASMRLQLEDRDDRLVQIGDGRRTCICPLLILPYLNCTPYALELKYEILYKRSIILTLSFVSLHNKAPVPS